MTTNDKVKVMLDDARGRLLSMRRADGMWEGALSSSAISTSVSVFALYLIDKDEYEGEITRGVEWLIRTMHEDGSWGDSVESPSNMTATLLAYTSLYALGKAPEESRNYLKEKFGGVDEERIVRGVLDYYGSDLTFSVPILIMCALAGVIGSWKKIPVFPFELAVLPQRLFRFLNLPVVSYAIPALIAVGILQYRKRGNKMKVLREPFVRRTLDRLIILQPEDGGFLEAAPLTAFCSMCLCAAGYRDHVVTQKAASFLRDTVREDGAWPIDTNLASWVTALSAIALGDDISDRQALADVIKGNQTKMVHPFTGAPRGGWGWTNLSGSVPDGDDTSGALVALYTLTHGTYSDEVGHGLEWLMALQNNDGGMPTFCKGWGKLPFDRSSPDITAHAVLAMGLWKDRLTGKLKERCQHSLERMYQWLEAHRNSCGDWTPLWFGDQDAKDEKNPVYGTATLMDYLYTLQDQRAKGLADGGRDFLRRTQNADGGWGGNAEVNSKVTLTAKAVAALAGANDPHLDECIDKGIDYLYNRYTDGTLYDREPIGLYFARLWYSEELYNLTYLVKALKRVERLELRG